MHDLTRLLSDANVRIERLIWLPGACHEPPPQDLIDFVEDIGPSDPILDELPEIKAAILLAIDEDMSDAEAAADVAQRLASRSGFLLQAATPVTRDHLPNGAYMFSWGHYRTRWLYAETVEAAVAPCIRWAQDELMADKTKALATAS